MRVRLTVVVALVVMLSASAQNTSSSSTVNGYPILDASRVYSAGQNIRVEEPHGTYSGLILMDNYYFLRPTSLTEAERKQDTYGLAVKGTMTVAVRHTIESSWQEMVFSYGCDDRDFKIGRTELARTTNGHDFIVGDHNAVCDLRQQAKSNPRPTSPQVTGSHVSVEPWQTLVHDTISVNAGKAVQYNFGLTSRTRLSAQFQVSGGLNDKIQVMVLDQINYQRYSSRQQFATLPGAPGMIRGLKRFNFVIPQTGVYYVVLDNGRAWLMPRSVTLHLYALLPEMTPEARQIQSSLEAAYSALKQFFMFDDFRIFVRHCGTENAFSNPNITLCVELLDELVRQSLRGAITFVFLHELGHTLMREWGLPFYDNEDDADQFATVFLMMGKQQQAALQAAQWWASQNTKPTDAVAKIWLDDRHSLSPQRARNVDHWLNRQQDLISRWQSVFIPHIQTATLQNLLRNPEGFDREQVRSELTRRGVSALHKNE